MTRFRPAQKIAPRPCLLAQGLTLVLLLSLAPPGTATETHDNDPIAAGLAALIATHNAALPLSFSPDPFVGLPAEGVTYTSNLALKAFPAILDVPADKTVFPNTADQCARRVELNQTRAPFADYLGLIKFDRIPEDWSIFGTPFVAHTNTDVELLLKNATYIESDAQLVCAGDPDPGSECFELLPQTFELPAGKHEFVWEANTKINWLLDYWLPPLMAAMFNEFRHGGAALDAATSGAEQVAKRQKKAIDKLLDWVEDNPFATGVLTEAGFVVADRTLGLPEAITATHQRAQSISVFDVHPPTLVVPPVVTLEATDIGGVTYERVRAQLRAAVSATDECGRVPSYGVDAPPALFTLGDNQISWVATDAGPIANPQPGGPTGNRVSATQIVRVVDTQGPILVPPPGRVVEVSGASAVAASELNLGAPRVVDLADANPSVAQNGPSSFPLGSRSEIVWSATDQAGNTTSASQLVTVKAAGTNTAPIAFDQTANTLTSEPVDIVLRGEDADFLDDRFDPLSFRLLSRPTQGEFVAPLYPFFIEDFREPSTDVYGDGFRLSGNKTAWMTANVCGGSLELRRDWIYLPEFVQVTDEGDYFVLDRYWTCSGSGNAGTTRRLSKWNRDGAFLAQVDYEGTDEQFRWEASNFVDTVRLSKDGSGNNRIIIYRCNPDLAEPCRILWGFGVSNTPGLVPNTLKFALIDDARGLAYVTDQNRIFVYDVRAGEPNGLFFPPLLGSLTDRDGALDVLSQSRGNCTGESGNSGYTLDVDSQGNLYALEACGERVHKFEPSGFDAAGSFQPGAHVGWLGRCDSSTNNACDNARGASKGFSCTDSTCAVSQKSGAETGQFSTPTHLVVDPNDVLYVADRSNNRVQRFAPDGTFAGVANSTGSGVNQGDEPGFVLGNMGQPNAVSVNSTQFFVLDREEKFLHVFETSPLKDITDSSATVTYVSNFDAHTLTDTFEFSVSDGLADSLPATVDVNVSRNFRAPVAIAQTITLEEDTAVEFTLTGDDPDGIAGVDFNGLDTLSFRVVRPPRFGQLSAATGGAQRTYTPNAEFSGTDSLEFVVNDGREDSSPATLTLEVTAVNDLPRILDAGFNQRIGLGFPATLSATFFDDGEVRYRTLASWGDGVQESNGGVVGEGADARVEGVVVDAPFAPSTTGRMRAQHVYDSVGPKAVQFCLWNDDTQGGCEDLSITVEELVSLDLGVVSASATLPHGSPVEFAVTLTNRLPEVGSGLRANAVVVSQPDSEFEATALIGAPLGCAVVDRRVNCLLPSLAAGETVSFGVRGTYTGSELFDTEAAFTLQAQTPTPSLADNVRGLQVLSLVADATDTDNDGLPDVWETAFGLTVGRDDSNDDGDADGLANIDEFRFRTDPANADTDNDGLSDGLEVALGGNPLVTADSDSDGVPNDADLDDDNDGMPDAAELAAGLDPFSSADALGDADGDGVSNLAEVRAGSDPADATSVPNSNGGGVSLYASILPLSRSVQIADQASAFATLLNDSDDAATGCSVAPLGSAAAQFSYWRTDPATNAVLGEINPTVTIAPRGSQSFVFVLQPSEALDRELAFQFVCAGRSPAASFEGINTFRLQASAVATPDMVAASATLSGDGVVELNGGAGAFAVGSFNVGASGTLTVRARSDADVTLTLCQTNTATGQCINPDVPADTVEVIVENGAAPSFGVFVSEQSAIPFDPVGNRVVVEFVDAGGVVRGGTGVAIRSLP